MKVKKIYIRRGKLNCVCESLLLFKQPILESRMSNSDSDPSKSLNQIKV